MEGPALLLSASGIHHRFGSLVVLNKVDFSVATGEAVGIVGPNGAGKTTLLNVLAGALHPEAGEVRFRDAEITGLDAAERCRLGIGRSHQIPRPFLGMTVFENLITAAMHGGRFSVEEGHERCIDSLQLTGMMQVANRRADTLGLLDRKRLELARALATDPALLLLDEIGGGLTDGEAAELVGIILEIRRRGITIVWIEHIVHILVQVVGRLICMDAGQVIADGDPKTVLADKEVIDAYLGGVAA